MWRRIALPLLARRHGSSCASKGPTAAAAATATAAAPAAPTPSRFPGEVKPFSAFLTDSFGRQHTYLRISLSERCNLRCA
jgi:cyclic pyranopterin phosphate synthase